MKREIAIDKLIENADKCINMLDLCHKLGIENVGGEDYKEVRDLAKELSIELKFSYKRNYNFNNKKMPIEEILVENSNYANRERLKIRLIKEGIKEYKCENPECGLSEWHGKPISLQLHHINGVHNDNRIENLMLLCPNCHSQTDTYAGKNSNREKNTTHILTSKRKNITEKIIIDKNTLIEDFKTLKSFKNVGKKYGVSDNAVRKWCKKLKIGNNKKEIKETIQGYGVMAASQTPNL